MTLPVAMAKYGMEEYMFKGTAIVILSRADGESAARYFEVTTADT